MIVAYWIVAGVLALMYLAAGGMKLAQPRQKLQASGMGFVEDFSAPSVKLVGAVEVLGALGSERAWVVHGADGLDELTTTGASYVAELKNGKVTTFEVTPEYAGLPRVTPEALKGGDPDANAAAVLDILGGKLGAYRDIVLLNAAAAPIVANKATDLKDGVARAAKAIDTGRARATLDALVATSQRAAAAISA